ncbi:hypothetical protein NFIA_070450 [Paecilomyces variotii No. 5]|uniref:Uncharacterized protein n=1 Tax=Byssochlamys spectabilis (strain No. 5 / NBRC 109023) TaxID=1356009 RepID=V5F8J6_BYSSN|nr:hypothetical protein NFIA_070450 [Paecilomyces variotii No. 5]
MGKLQALPGYSSSAETLGGHVLFIRVSAADMPQVQIFCNILIQNQPALLDQLLQKAIDDRDSQSFQTCISMLSHPLPRGIVLPARVSTFVERLVQKMVDIPSADTIYPLHQVTSSMHGSSSLLEAFSDETMANFQTECTKILRNLDDHMGNLLCLATFARIAAARIPKNYTGNDNLPGWLQNIRQFFGPKRASKTLDLVVLRVILACSSSFNMSPKEAIQSVRLAMEICDTIDSDQRRAWLEKNTSRVAKLCEKLRREGIDRKLQVMGIAFLVSFLSTAQLSEDLRAVCKQTLLSDEGRRCLQELPDNVFRIFVPQITSYLDNASITSYQTMFEIGASKNWRAKISQTLIQNAYSSHETVVHKIEEICRDLEYRCHNVEAPLRDVTDQRDQLVLELEALERRNRELEIRVEQSSHAAHTLQQEMAHLEEKAQSASARSKDLATQLAAAQKELEDEKRDSQEIAASEREKSRSKELDLMASLTEKEDQIEDLQSELHDKSLENERLRETIETVMENNTSGCELIASLRQEIDELQHSLRNKISHNDRMDSEIRELVSHMERLHSERDGLQDKLEREASESNRLRTAVRETEESHRLMVAALEQQHQSDLSNITTQALQETSRLTDEINLLRISLQATESKASSERKESSRKIKKLQQKVEALRNERAAKAREFSEAQEHITRLMGVMGFKKDRNDSVKPTTREERPNPVLKGSTFKESLGMAEESINDSYIEEDSQLAASFGSTASSNYAPTPKWPKNSRKSQALSHASFDDGSRPGTTRKEQPRIPLGECDRNSPGKSSQDTSKATEDEEVFTRFDSQVGTQIEGQQFDNSGLDLSDEDIFTDTASRLMH